MHYVCNALSSAIYQESRYFGTTLKSTPKKEEIYACMQHFLGNIYLSWKKPSCRR